MLKHKLVQVRGKSLNVTWVFTFYFRICKRKGQFKTVLGLTHWKRLLVFFRGLVFRNLNFS